MERIASFSIDHTRLQPGMVFQLVHGPVLDDLGVVGAFLPAHRHVQVAVIAALVGALAGHLPVPGGDPLVGISLYDNSILLGVTDGYVANSEKQYLGCGVEIYLTIPSRFFQFPIR